MTTRLPTDRARWRPRHWAAWAWERLPRVNPTVPELLAVIRQIPRTCDIGQCRGLAIEHIRIRYAWEAYRRGVRA